MWLCRSGSNNSLHREDNTVRNFAVLLSHVTADTDHQSAVALV